MPDSILSQLARDEIVKTKTWRELTTGGCLMVEINSAYCPYDGWQIYSQLRERYDKAQGIFTSNTSYEQTVIASAQEATSIAVELINKASQQQKGQPLFDELYTNQVPKGGKKEGS